MISRREFLQATAAAAAIWGAGRVPALGQGLTEDALTAFETTGNVTLIHLTDLHAQLRPIYYREPSMNIGVGEAAGLPPHVTGEALLDLFGLTPGSPMAHALTPVDYVALAREYGRMGGLDRIATVVRRIRADRPDALLLDGGDTWQGSLTSLRTRGQDMIRTMGLLKPDAMTAHWEFTYGGDYVREQADAMAWPLLGANIFDAEWDEPAYDPMAWFERGGTKIAVIGQAFPYLPIANPGHLFPGLSFGIRDERLAEVAQQARDEGAGLVVLLSHNGFDVDRKLAAELPLFDVILSGHTHDALPEPVKVGRTLIVASGSNGKFVSRLDLDVGPDGVRDFAYRLIPIFSDAITPDPEMAALIDEVRAPFEEELQQVVGRTGSLLYRRGNFNGTMDDLICQALLEQRDAEIALSPGFRWGTTLMPDSEITREDVMNLTAITYPEAYRQTMSGEMLHTVLEDVADNLFNPDPFYQQGGDMVRVGGVGYSIDVSRPMGQRIRDLTLLVNGERIDPARDYVVTGWASVNPEVEGPPMWEVVEAHLAEKGEVEVQPTDAVAVTGL